MGLKEILKKINFVDKSSINTLPKTRIRITK